MSDIDPLAQHEAEREILKLSRALTENTKDTAILTTRVAELQLDYDITYARAYLDAKPGTIPERRALAQLVCEEEAHELALAKALLTAARAAGHNIRAQLDSLRSINANIRDHVAHPYGRGG